MKPAALPVLLLLSLGAAGACAPQTIGALGDAGGDTAAIAPVRTTPSLRDAGPIDAMASFAPGPQGGPPPCPSRSSYDTCMTTADCRWLTPGCGNPPHTLPRSGCYPKSELNCASDAACTGGRHCTPTDIDPCYSPGGGPAGVVGCASCGMLVNLCL